MASIKMLSFPDRYLLRGIMVLVAISVMVPGIFGVAPPRWFDHGIPQPAEREVAATKTEQASTVITQVVTLSVSDKLDQTGPQTVDEASGASNQLAESSVPNAALANEPRTDKSDQIKATPMPLLAASQFSANRVEQPAVKARKDKSEVQIASASPKIAKIKPNQLSRPLLVARVFAKRIPAEHLDLATPAQKESFIRMTLPMILAANEEITQRRKAIERAVSRGDQTTVERWARLYRIESDGRPLAAIERQLLLRADLVPVSRALAQAAIESGWGTSRFALQGNALFGQWAWQKDAGLKPARASNSKAVVRSFPNLFGSVRAYMHNLNTPPRYAAFRARRHLLRGRTQSELGYQLSNFLDGYAEIGEVYVAKLKTLIRSNDLGQYEAARLR